MVDPMAKVSSKTDNNDLVVRARTDSSAMGRLYELYYPGIYRFCVHRLFSKEAAQDVTSTVFLDVARKIHSFAGTSENEFRSWVYAIASNHANSYIRKTSRRKKLFKQAVWSMAANRSDQTVNSNHQGDEYNWPTVYKAILELSPREQTIITLRFFEKLSFETMAQILDRKPSSVRVTLSRSLKKLRKQLKTV